MTKLTKEQEITVASELQRYFETETEYSLTQIGALQLIDFLNDHVGKYYYNKALVDAEAFLNEKVADLIMLEQV